MLVIRKNYCHEVGQIVWTVERLDGKQIGGDAGMAVGISFDSEDKALACIDKLGK